MRRFLTVLAVSSALAFTPAMAQDQAGKADAEEAAKADAGKPDKVEASSVEDAQPRKDSVTTSRGQKIAYTATPGHLTLRDDDGEAIASLFYVAYTADNLGSKAKRPVTFLFNGGPGSSTMWLHMGSWGPVRVDTPTPTAYAPAPFAIGKNPLTMLDISDLVFIDALGTGLSRPLGKHKASEFWGVDNDLKTFTQGIVRYLSINDRWNSPKFVYGESYGTLRAAGLALSLQKAGVQPNGIILQSSILNYGARQVGFDIDEVRMLPSYAATAWYHNRLANKPAALEPFLTEVRRFATGPYLNALAQGFNLPADQRQAIAQQLSAYTGISPQVLLAGNLRIDLNRYRKELLRDSAETIGRLDSRFMGPESEVLGDRPEYDATDTSMTGPYVAALNSYLFGTLGYKTPLYYRPNYYSGMLRGWDQSHTTDDGRKQALAATSLDLAAAMRQNPHLKVLAMNGYYDLATPFFGAEWDLAHMSIPDALKSNITYTYYESGHMIYIDPPSMKKMKDDLDAFYASAQSGN